MRLQESIYIPPIISTTYSGKSNYVNGMISRLKEIINSEKSFIKPKPFDYKKYFQQTPTELRSPPLVKEMTERLSSMLAKASTPQVKKVSMTSIRKAWRRPSAKRCPTAFWETHRETVSPTRTSSQSYYARSGRRLQKTFPPANH